MQILKYNKDSKQYEISFRILNENVVELQGDFPVQTNGFMLSRDGEEWYGDYSDYTTVYRQVDDRVQFSNNGSVYTPPEPIPEPEPYVPTLEEVQEAKVAEMQMTQKAVIAEGITVVLEDGTEEHFTLSTDDKTYLMGLQIKVAAGKEILPWHTSDESEHCKFYTNADMAKITSAAMDFVTWHETYFPDLRIYIRSLDSREAVEAVTYGMEIPEGHRSEPLQAMMAAQGV